jgi:hypothetical protein
LLFKNIFEFLCSSCMLIYFQNIVEYYIAKDSTANLNSSLISSKHLISSRTSLGF